MGLVFNHSDQIEQRRRLRYNQTFSEKLVWNSLRAGQLGVIFRRQFSVERYVLDFYCARRRLAVEIDGGVHDSDKARKHDAERTAFLNSLGITVLRFTNRQIDEQLDWVIQQIQQTVLESTRTLDTSPMPSPSKGEG